jgi:dolichol-phosphate mannosyltransferase
VPYHRGVRQHGVTNYSLRRMVELAVTGIAAHSLRPLRFAIYLALGFVLIGFALVIYSLISFLFVRHTVAGWSSIMATIAILGAAQLLVLGIIGEYVGAPCAKCAGGRATWWPKRRHNIWSGKSALS